MAGDEREPVDDGGPGSLNGSPHGETERPQRSALRHWDRGVAGDPPPDGGDASGDGTSPPPVSIGLPPQGTRSGDDSSEPGSESGGESSCGGVLDSSSVR